MKIPTQRVSHTLRNRVSTTRYLATLSAQSPAALADFDAATTYSYDIHGNVDTLVQQYRKGMMASHGDNRFKVMTYQYDLISGKVNQVHYQPGEPDQYYHRYAYDAENRITDVYTTTNKALIGSDVLEDHEAFYSYYTHGPLARTILGQQQVQGVDYAYTLQGWLKGVNAMALDTAIDMGRDGGGTITARDAYGFQLNYFSGDYKPVNTSRNPFPGHSAYIGAAYRPLYNGNISSMGVNIGKLNQPQLYNYEYDQLNRLVSMQAYRGFSGNSWSGITATTDHQESITYDGNGNIVSYLRNGNTSAGKPLAMDNLGYAYNKDGSGNLLNNKLRHVTDAVTNNANYTEDIDGQVADNYSYDQIGNLTGDSQEKIDSIEWNVYGKIAQIWKENSPSVGELQRIAYRYDASGNRISKTVYSNQDASNYKAVHTWYVRDASGNVMATYSSEDVVSKSTLATGTLGKLYLSELHMNGSSRLGIWNRKVDMDVLPASGGEAPLLGTLGIDTFNRGNKFFELANHLGSVLVTVSDKKIGVDQNSDGTNDYFNADVVSAQDYYPFGQVMPGRQFGSLGRYGFNGKEQDKEVKGSGAQYDYGFRIYDPRIGKFLSVDPLTKTYPYYTPYQFAGNTPIKFIDLDGLEPAAPQTVDAKGKKILHNVEPGTRKPYNSSGGENTFNMQPSLNSVGTNKMVSPGVVHDLLAEGSPSALQFKEYTNTNTAFFVSPNAKGSDGSWINLMLGNYMWGEGYENWVFPEGSTMTSGVKNSNIVAKALINMGNSSSYSSKVEFTPTDQGESLFRNKSFLTAENFVGSANTYFQVNSDKSISVTVFNVTSITSGDIVKHLPFMSWPVSIVRDKPGSASDRGLTPWSNMSQTFNFTLNQNEAAQLINNYKQRMDDYKRFIGVITQPGKKDQ